MEKVFLWNSFSTRDIFSNCSFHNGFFGQIQVWIESFPEILCLDGIFPKLTSFIEISSCWTVLSEVQLGQISSGTSFSLKIFFYTRYFSKLLISPWIFWTNTSLDRVFPWNSLSWRYFPKLTSFIEIISCWTVLSEVQLGQISSGTSFSLKIFFYTRYFSKLLISPWIFWTNTSLDRVFPWNSLSWRYFPKLTSFIEIISCWTVLSEVQLGQISGGTSFSLKIFFYTRYFPNCSFHNGFFGQIQVWKESFPEILCLDGIFPKLTSLIEIISLNTILSEPQLGQISCGKSFSLKFSFYTRYFSKRLISPWIFWTNTCLDRVFPWNSLS